MEHLIQEDILSGHGLCLIDPHGTTYENVLRWLITSRTHQHRTVYILDPTRPEWSVGFNPLAFKAGNLTRVDYSISSVVDAITTAFGSDTTDQTPLLERVLTVALYVAFYSDLTLAELPNILSSVNADGTRMRLQAHIGDWYIQQQCNELYGMSKHQFREHVHSAHNRLSRLLTSPVIRRMVGQQGRVLDLHEIIEDGDIFLVNLSAGNRALSQERQRLIGSLLVNDFFLNGQMRPEDSRPFYLYIDECHRFLTKDIEAILVESRKRGIHATLAHQNLGQLRAAGERIYSAVMGSAQTKVVFGMEDMNEARTMAENVFAHPEDIDLEEPKESLVTYQTVGHNVVWLKSESEAQSHGITNGRSQQRSEGNAVTRQQSTTAGKSVSETEGEGSHEGSGASIGEGISELEDGTVIIYETEGDSETSGRSSFSAHTISRSQSTTRGHSISRSRQKTAGRSRSYSRSKAQSHGRSQATVPIVEETKMHTYSLEEQLYRRGMEIKNLSTAQAILKVPQRQHIKLQVPYVDAGYARLEQVRQLVDHLLAAQPSALPVAEAARQIEMRQERLLENGTIQEEPDNW
jgi:hypothetical protein